MELKGKVTKINICLDIYTNGIENNRKFTREVEKNENLLFLEILKKLNFLRIHRWMLDWIESGINRCYVNQALESKNDFYQRSKTNPAI